MSCSSSISSSQSFVEVGWCWGQLERTVAIESAAGGRSTAGLQQSLQQEAAAAHAPMLSNGPQQE
jgi:hypothetical protein